MNNETMRYIVERIKERALEAVEERNKDKSEFECGRTEAYYEVLDIVKTELMANAIDLKEYGLDFNLEKALI